MNMKSTLFHLTDRSYNPKRNNQKPQEQIRELQYKNLTIFDSSRINVNALISFQPLQHLGPNLFDIPETETNEIHNDTNQQIND